MSNIVLLKNQHNEIFSMVKTIETLTAQNLNGNAKDIAYSISALSGKLKMHLMSEDQFLYPNLIKSQNKAISSTANTFNKEMGGLADAFKVFVQKYKTQSEILQNTDAFVNESKAVFQLITDRINRENSQLYPLLDI